MVCNVLIQRLESSLAAGMVIPNEIRKLYEWVDANGFCNNDIGYLFDHNTMMESWTDTGRLGGTDIRFFTDYDEDNPVWYEDGNNRLREFASAGADGTSCALWLDDNKETKVVIIGSISGCILCCSFDSALEFLRLVAIGYDELADVAAFVTPPNEYNEGFYVEPNIPFQKWVCKTFKTSIPKSGREILPSPATFYDESSDDPFCRWFVPNVYLQMGN